MDVLTDTLPRNLKVSLKDIKLATKNFTTVIGNGGFGHVFKGELYLSGKITTVAVKRLQFNNVSGQGLKEFLTEIQLLSRCKHSNVVSLVGFCGESKENVLVYEYASHGSLDKYIVMGQTATNNLLTWKQRIRICIDAASGLDYLHNSFARNQRIIHRDIKSANILLDHNWKSMIADFGLSKLGRANENETFIVTNAAGTNAYLDPVYLTSGILTKESDIYSFGIVLFEVMCGRLAYVNLNGEARLLGPLAKSSYEKGKMSEIIHPDLKKQMSSDSLNTFSEIAYQCLHTERNERPSTVEVVKKLVEALEFQEIYEADREREKGNEYFKQQKYTDAIIHYTECIKMNPKDVRAYSNRAACYTELGSWREALNDAGTCIEIAPNFSKGYSRKGVIQFRMREYAKALETYKEGLKYDPLNDALLDGVKMCNQEIERANHNEFYNQEPDNKYESKEAQYRIGIQKITESLRRNPESARAYANRASCYKMLGEMKNGLKDAQKCIDLDPTLTRGYIEKSSILFGMKRFDEALKTYKEGLKYDPLNNELLAGVKRCNQEIQGANYNHQYRTSDPEIADTDDFEKGNEYFREGKFSDAIRHYRKHLRGKPKDLRAYCSRATCYRMLGQLPQGLKDAEMCIQLDPMIPYGYIEKSLILIYMTKYDKALETCQEGLKYDPQNVVLRECVMRCSMELGRGANYAGMQSTNIRQSPHEVLPEPSIRQPNGYGSYYTTITATGDGNVRYDVVHTFPNPNQQTWSW